MKREGGREGDKGRREESGRCELVTCCGIKVSSIASGEGLISDDPFFSRAQPYA